MLYISLGLKVQSLGFGVLGFRLQALNRLGSKGDYVLWRCLALEVCWGYAGSERAGTLLL